MVARQDDAPGAPYGYPAGRLKGLRGLVDKQGGEFLALQQAVGGAHERGGDDARLPEQFGVDAYLEFGGATLQPFQLLVVTGVAPLALLPELTNGLADGP